MEQFTSLYNFIDSILMPLYRFPENRVVGYFFGTSVLSVLSILIGECSISLAFRLNRHLIEKDSRRLIRYQDLSFAALKAGDKDSFKACNSIANEAYGKSFFNQITLSAASLWPAFIALGWMQYRFSGVALELPVPIPLIGRSLGYVSTFLICYIATRIVIGKSRRFMKKKSNI